MCPRKRTVELIRAIAALPSIPTVVERLTAVLRDPDYTADQVTEVVRTDPALTARVLKLANSPAYGYRGDIESVSRAVVILGSRSLRSVITTAGVIRTMEKVAAGSAVEELWCHAAYTATAAQVLALRTGHPCPEEAFLAGLIHDIGDLALAAVRPAEFARARQRPADDWATVQRECLGMVHTRAGRQLLTAWNLPEYLAAVAANHHEPEAVLDPEQPTLTLVALGDLLSRVRGLGHEPAPTDAHLQDLVEAAGLKTGVTAELLREIDLRYLETSRFLHPDQARIQAPFAAADRYRVTTVCADAARSILIRELVVYHGHESVPCNQWYDAPTSVDLVILDPRCLDEHALARLAPSLAPCQDRLALYADGDIASLTTDLPDTLPILPPLFTPTDLANLLCVPTP